MKSKVFGSKSRTAAPRTVRESARGHGEKNSRRAYVFRNATDSGRKVSRAGTYVQRQFLTLRNDKPILLLIFGSIIRMNGDPNNSDLFKERQASDSLRGYAYQVALTALAWIDLGEKSRLYLKVAEDYATVSGDVLNAVQIKDTAASSSVALKSDSVRGAICAFIDLVARNPDTRLG
jgi:hypothetical protein